MKFCSQGCYGYFNLTLSASADVTILIIKILKTNAIFEIIFFINAIFEIIQKKKITYDMAAKKKNKEKGKTYNK